VFVRLVGQLQNYRDRGKPLLAWLYTVARNLLVDHHRRNGRYQWLPLDEQMEAGDGSCPLHAAERSLARSVLVGALDSLTEAQRQVILLKFIEGRSNAEVATILSKDEGSVKSLQHRALAALRRVLAKEH
jgi:RNA polymerase sigma-70 factor (ECF subfamily)